jgi:hypothetical protein
MFWGSAERERGQCSVAPMSRAQSATLLRWYAILRCHISSLTSHLGWLTFLQLAVAYFIYLSIEAKQLPAVFKSRFLAFRLQRHWCFTSAFRGREWSVSSAPCCTPGATSRCAPESGWTFRRTEKYRAPSGNRSLIDRSSNLEANHYTDWNILADELNFTLIFSLSFKHIHVFSKNLYFQTGYAMAQLVEVLRYKPKGRGLDSRWGQWNFSLS